MSLCIAVAQGVGRAFATAALDLKGCNPWSRLPNSEHRSMDGLRSWLLTCLKAPHETRAANLPPMSQATIDSIKDGAQQAFSVSGAGAGSRESYTGGASGSATAAAQRMGFQARRVSFGRAASTYAFSDGNGISPSSSAVSMGSLSHSSSANNFVSPFGAQASSSTATSSLGHGPGLGHSHSMREREREPRESGSGSGSGLRSNGLAPSPSLTAPTLSSASKRAAPKRSNMFLPNISSRPPSGASGAGARELSRSYSSPVRTGTARPSSRVGSTSVAMSGLGPGGGAGPGAAPQRGPGSSIPRPPSSSVDASAQASGRRTGPSDSSTRASSSGSDGVGALEMHPGKGPLVPSNSQKHQQQYQQQPQPPQAQPPPVQPVPVAEAKPESQVLPGRAEGMQAGPGVVGTAAGAMSKRSEHQGPGAVGSGTGGSAGNDSGTDTTKPASHQPPHPQPHSSHQHNHHHHHHQPYPPSDSTSAPQPQVPQNTSTAKPAGALAPSIPPAATASTAASLSPALAVAAAGSGATYGAVKKAMQQSKLFRKTSSSPRRGRPLSSAIPKPPPAAVSDGKRGYEG